MTLKNLKKLFERMNDGTKEARDLRSAYEAGAAAAADLADQYNGSTTHEYRLGDCILGKMNIRKGKPRKNEHRRLTHKDLLEILGPFDGSRLPFRRRRRPLVVLPR